MAAGLPPRATVEALERDLADWSDGPARPERYDDAVRRARAAFARIVRIDPDRVAVGSQVSVGVSLFADWVPDGAEVLCATGDFSSMVFPFLAQGDRIRVRHVPVAALAGEIRPETALVSFSLVQSANGDIADGAAIAAAARAVDARTLCDLTQAAGWLPVEAAQFDATVCATYKWLCAPRGVSFVTVAADLGAELRAVHAGWFAGANVLESCCGPQMTLAESARRFDVSPVWPCWVGAAASLELFAEVDPAELHDHDVALADLFRARLDLAASGSAIISLSDPDGSRRAALEVAGCVVARRAGGTRLSFHAWNDEADVEHAVRALDVGLVRSVRACAGR